MFKVLKPRLHSLSNSSAKHLLTWSATKSAPAVISIGPYGKVRDVSINDRRLHGQVKTRSHMDIPTAGVPRETVKRLPALQPEQGWMLLSWSCLHFLGVPL